MAKRLFVVAPGITQTCDGWRPLVERLKRDVPDASWLLFEHHTSVLSRRTIGSVASELAASINEQFLVARPEHVTLIGHSFGGVLIRMAYLIAGGRFPRVSTTPMEWVTSVDRIVLFAAMNRGFDPDRLGRVASHVVRLLLLPPVLTLARGLTKGSDAMTDLRIAWIRYFRELGDRQPVVIQLRGTKDTLVEPEDSADVEQFPGARQELVAGANHANLHMLPPEKAEERYAFLKHHILDAQGRGDAPHTESEKTDVVFLVHGIRASNSQWPERARRIIEREYPSAVPVTAGYTYFSALNFALPFLRRRQIRWMQDEYSYRFARHRNACFHFLGHSNGTYLLGNTLRNVPSVEFNRVTLVSSVLPQEYEWGQHVPTRVKEVHNHRANHDIPVSLLCAFLRGLGMRDVGTAGYDGFLSGDASFKREFFYYSGGHGAVLRDDSTLKRLIDYTLTGRPPAMELVANAPPLLSLTSRTVRALAWILLVALAASLWMVAAAIAPFAADMLQVAPEVARWLAMVVLLTSVGVVLKVF